jgi:pimeloyl-ACP methyl ester carboxylesterase
MRDLGLGTRGADGDGQKTPGRRIGLRTVCAAGIVSGLICALASPVTSYATEHEEPPTSFEPVLEAENFSITQQRQAIYDTPEYQQQLAEQGAKNREEATTEQAGDPERNFSGDLCYEGENGCAGDVRLYKWEKSGYGRVRKVLFTARNGATISARIWSAVNPATNPNAKLPGIVITNGSVQADEQLYWYAAQALAKDGYLVMTFDPQGQGQSDTFGQAPDEQEGFPAQSDGRPFFDGTEDAINFFLSNPKHPYVPVPSCETGTSHAAKQNERVKKGLDAPYNPFWHELKTTQIGLAGHSYGAAGVSYIGQWDPRVKAIVAWDNLAAPNPNEKTGASGGGPAEKPCPSTPADRTVPPITKPALGMSADYFLPPTPNKELPNPQAKSTESHAYSEGGVDSGEIIIRGGSHLDFSFIPNQAFGASLRGADEIAWYTSAWFDKYVKHQTSADKRLLTNRWREDPVEAAVDRHHDGDAMSFYYYSRLDVRLASGEAFDCENLRKGCPGMFTEREPGSYSYLATDTSPLGFDKP